MPKKFEDPKDVYKLGKLPTYHLKEIARKEGKKNYSGLHKKQLVELLIPIFNDELRRKHNGYFKIEETIQERRRMNNRIFKEFKKKYYDTLRIGHYVGIQVQLKKSILCPEEPWICHKFVKANAKIVGIHKSTATSESFIMVEVVDCKEDRIGYEFDLHFPTIGTTYLMKLHKFMCDDDAIASPHTALKDGNFIIAMIDTSIKPKHPAGLILAGYMKNDESCAFARLPKDLIRVLLKLF
jgi:hypothetical protein